LANKDKKIVEIDDFAIKSAKTKDAVKALADAKVDNFRRILLVAEKSENNLRAVANLANVNLVSATYLNVKDILDSDRIVFTKKALDETTAWLKGDE
jgi:large subunit ribosomal protein L4